MSRSVGTLWISIAVAQLAPLRIAAPMAGFVYFVIGPLQYANGWYFGRRIEALEAELAPQISIAT